MKHNIERRLALQIGWMLIDLVREGRVPESKKEEHIQRACRLIERGSYITTPGGPATP